MAPDTAEDIAKVTTLAQIIEAINGGDDLIEMGRLMQKRPENVLGLLLRDLSKEEIAVMEDRGCHADDWSLIQVAEDFNPFRVRRTYFIGRCIIGRFDAEVELRSGMQLPTGIYDCTLVDCQVGNNCLLEKVRYASRCIVEHGAALFDVGSITCSGAAHFGCGGHLGIAIETGGREVPVWAGMTLEDAALIAGDRVDVAGQTALQEAVAAYVGDLPGCHNWIRRGAVLRHSEHVHDVFVGPGALIDHALELSDVAVLSTADERTTITGGAAVSESVVQWGACVQGHAIVKRSVLLEHSGADENGVVTDSIIGPNSKIAKGEVTASLVGPFVGFHHQSLLIAAYWPAGRGNVAYGAMVGSNHTGRAPDQEIWPGEGMFFGLGCSIRFPSDFSQAPYSTISAGVSTLAQRMTLPFSLITTPVEALQPEGATIPRAYNELMPGWGLYANAYGLERTEVKLAKRDRAQRHKIHYHVLRPGVISEVRRALAALEDALATEQLYYLDTDVPGIGKNFVRRAAMEAGVNTYRRVLQRYALRILLGEQEGSVTIPGSAELAHELLDELMPGTDVQQRLQELVAIEQANAEIVQSSKAADDVRGARIIPGYADAHQPAADDPIVAVAWERVRKTEARVQAVLAR